MGIEWVFRGTEWVWGVVGELLAVFVVIAEIIQ